MSSLEIDASGLVKIAEYDGFVGIGTSQAFSQYSGKMEINAPSGYKGLILRPASGVSQPSIFEIQDSSSGILWRTDFQGMVYGSTGVRIELASSSGKPALLINAPSNAIWGSGNMIEFYVANNKVSAITPSGSFSGAVTPTVITSTGLTLTDSHNGYIIEQTGVVSSGTFTIGTTSQITIPGWNCMVVNIGSGVIIASGSNIMKSPGGLNKSRTQYSSISIYRRTSGDFVLGGDLA